MDMNIIISIIAGICTAIPLIVKLYQQIKENIQQKNWKPLMELTMKYMETAEQKLETGAEKKEYVMAMVKVSAEQCGYEYNEQVIADMIDSMCSMAKNINTTTKTTKTKN